jgi:autotransporter-associated beta strand protein
LNICDVNTGFGSLEARDNAQVTGNNIFVGKGAGSTGILTIRNNATVVSGNGITLASGDAASLGTVNLNGGSLAVNLVQGNPGIGVFNFNGGKLIARNPFAANFMFNLAAINVQAGGAFIDSDIFQIAISDPLLGDPAGDGGLTKLGVGTLLLNGVNTYTNVTLVTAGTLGGTGTFPGPVTVQAAGTLSPGAGGLGIFTVNNNLTLAGNVAVDLDKSVLPSSDSVVVSGTLNNIGTGTVKVTNLGPALQAGDTFTLFNKPVVGGASLAISGAGAAWTNRLAIDGSIRVISTVPNFATGGVVRLPDRNISLTAVGSVGSTYKLWASTNIALTPISTTWTLLSSGTVTVSPFTINDLTATNFPRRFYIFSTP